jgi:hypothetical protein
MGTVIYSASPLQALLGGIGAGLLILVLGAVAVLVAIFRRNQGRGSRIAMGVLGGLMLCGGMVVVGITLLSLLRGGQTVAVRLDNKRQAEQSCGQDTTSICISYLLETSNSSGSFDFEVPPGAYDLAQPDTCYYVSFVPRASLFSSANTGYQRISSVTRIEVADPAACQ